jgi:hypothetical protein
MDAKRKVRAALAASARSQNPAASANRFAAERTAKALGQTALVSAERDLVLEGQAERSPAAPAEGLAKRSSVEGLAELNLEASLAALNSARRSSVRRNLVRRSHSISRVVRADQGHPGQRVMQRHERRERIVTG